MTPAQIERLQELCENAEKGVLRGDELRELVGLAREAAVVAEEASIDPERAPQSFAPTPAENWSHEDAQDFYAGRFGY